MFQFSTSPERMKWVLFFWQRTDHSRKDYFYQINTSAIQILASFTLEIHISHKFRVENFVKGQYN